MTADKIEIKKAIAKILDFQAQKQGVWDFIISILK